MLQQVMKFLGLSLTSIGTGLQALVLASGHPTFSMQVIAMICSSLGGACAVFSPAVVHLPTQTIKTEEKPNGA